MNRWSAALELLLVLVVANNTPSSPNTCTAFVPAGLSPSFPRKNAFFVKPKPKSNPNPKPAPLQSYLDSLSNNADRSEDNNNNKSNNNSNSNSNSNGNTYGLGRGSFSNTTTTSSSSSSYAVPDPASISTSTSTSTSTSIIEPPAAEPRTPFQFQSYTDSLSMSPSSTGSSLNMPDLSETLTPSSSLSSSSPTSSFDEEDLQQQKESFVDVNLQPQEQESSTTVICTDATTDDASLVEPTILQEDPVVATFHQPPIEVEIIAASGTEYSKSGLDSDLDLDLELDSSSNLHSNSNDLNNNINNNNNSPLENINIDTSSALTAENNDNKNNIDNDDDNNNTVEGVEGVVSIYAQEIEQEAITLPDVSLSEAYKYEESIPTSSFTFPKEEEEEGVASIIVNTISSSLSVSTSRSYLASRLSLQESKNKNEKRMSRSVYEIEKTREAIEQIQQRAREQIEKAEKRLEDKLEDIQTNLDNEIEQITNLLTSQIQFEKKRETSLVKLIWTLQSAKLSKEEDIDAENKTTREMIELRTKMEDSTIASQLDVVIAQKQALGAINRCQVDDLNDLLDEAQLIVKETRALIALVEDTLDRVVPLTAGDQVYAFEDLEILQRVWKDASDRIDGAEVRMKALKSKYDSDRLNRLMLLGEPVPTSLQKVAKDIEMEMRGENVLQSRKSSQMQNKMIPPARENDSSTTQIVPSSSSSLSSKNINKRTHNQEDLSTKDDKELVEVLAMSVGKAAIASAKAGVFGFKALLETISDEEVSGITEEAIKKSAGISKVSSGLSESMKSMNSVKSKDDLKNVVSNDLKSGIESTGETLNAFGKAGKVIVNKVTSASSASQATDALRETSDDLIQAFNAITALSKKSIQRNLDKKKN